jgi:hypothetical protein
LLTVAARYGTNFPVPMTEAFASSVTVTVPILAPAAGAEARSLRAAPPAAAAPPAP